MSLDPRARTKVWIEAYDTPANVTKLDGVTLSPYSVAFALPTYPLKLVFFGTINDDITLAIQDPEVTPLIGYNKQAYAYIERVPIEVYAVDKDTTVSGLDAVWKMEKELRRIAETYPLGSVRTFQAMQPNTKNMGGWNLYSKRCVLTYKRAVETAQTAPLFSYGDDWIFEGDALTGGVGGTWDVSNHLGDPADTITTNTDNNMVVTTTTANDTYTHNGTAIGLSSTVYTTIIFRYKTTGSTTAKVIIDFSDASTQTVMAETASLTWKTVTATITTGKTINYVRFYGCDAAGTATCDFININKGNWIYPNVTEMTESFNVNDANIDVPGRQGQVTQTLGSGLYEVRLISDTTMEAGSTTQTWKRPQTTSPKSDYNNDDIFFEQLHHGGTDHLWHWFDTGTKQFKARLVEIHPSARDADGLIETVWREYRHGGSETVSERFGLTL